MAYSCALQYDLASRPQAVFVEVLLNIILTAPIKKQLYLLNILEGKCAILTFNCMIVHLPKVYQEILCQDHLIPKLA